MLLTDTPSSNDPTSLDEKVRRSAHHLPGFLLSVVGRRPSSEGLWVYFHLIDGTWLEAKNAHF